MLPTIFASNRPSGQPSHINLLLALLVTGALSAACSPPPTARAKNVVLFLGDGTGLPSLHAASVRATGSSQGLYLHKMPHLALSGTSSASSWVSDSAAGMTAIVTGEKTHNGVVSQASDAVRGSKDGQTLKTILEYAEERGLSTGIVTNSAATDATPAACYAHSNERDEWGRTFEQFLAPRFGDGVDVLIGTGRERLFKSAAEIGLDVPARVKNAGSVYLDDPAQLAEVPSSASRVVGLFNVAHQSDFDLQPAVKLAIDILSRNPNGFFLMVESNNHFREPAKTLDGVIRMDQIIRETADRLRATPTLLLVTADHSYDLRMPRGKGRTKDILDSIEIGGSHTAEQVPLMAEGPGSDAVQGFIENTQIFHIMMKAFGWNHPPAP